MSGDELPGISDQGTEAERLYGLHTGAVICAKAALGENPFECATLSVRALPAEYRCPADELRGATLAAIEQGNRHPELRKALDDVLARCRRTADESLADVRGLL